MARRLRARLVVNPAAGSGAAKARAEEFVRDLREIGYHAEVAVSTGLRDAERLARESDHDVVFALGGDGTAGAVASGLAAAGADSLFAPVSLGSAADLARNLGLRSPSAVLESLRQGRERRMDLGCATLTGERGERFERTFVLTTGTGFSPRVIRAARPWVKRVFRRHAYTFGGILAACGYRVPTMAWSIDGEEATGPVFNIVVANAEMESGGARMSPGASLFDGSLWVGVMRDVGALTGLWRMRLIFSGNHVHTPGFVYRRARAVTIDSQPPVEVQVDGELRGRTPVAFRVLPGCLRALVGPDVADGAG